MQISFQPATMFPPQIQKELESLSEQAFAVCKQQFSSDYSHASPHCAFYIGRSFGGTGNLSGFHIIFESTEDMLVKTSQEADILFKLIHHEMVHFFQAHLRTREPFEYLPRWFYEGMAVALSGQHIIARNRHLNSDYEQLGGDAGWKTNYLMNKYRHIDYSRPPYDVLYGSWGALFIFAVTNQPNIFPKHAITGKDGCLYSHVDEAECAKAVTIIQDASEIGFDAALEQHTARKNILVSDFRRFLHPE